MLTDVPVSALSHVELCANVALLALPGEGRTLCLREAVGAGQRLVRERPAAVADCKSVLAERVAHLLQSNHDALEPVLEISPDERLDPDVLSTKVQELITSHSFDFLDGANIAIFRVLGMINHACSGSEEANCCFSVPFDAGMAQESEAITLVSLRPIPAGGTLRMSYLCPFAPEIQLQTLQSIHNFQCNCSVCRSNKPPLVLRCCASCGSCENQALKRCGGCKLVFYCSEACQRIHRPEHQKRCKEARASAQSSLTEEVEIESFFKAVECEFDDVMEASGESLAAGASALNARTRFEGESQLDKSMERLSSFLARYCVPSDGVRATAGSSCRLRPEHPFLYYVRGNLVKQALTRLAMRFRLHGTEPAEGCGVLASMARTHLSGCLASAISKLPPLHVEVLSLLRDAADLAQLASDLCSLSADLKVWGQSDEGQVKEEGLDSVIAWASELLRQHHLVFDVYGEKCLIQEKCPTAEKSYSSASPRRVDPDDRQAYSVAEIVRKYSGELTEEESRTYWGGLQLAEKAKDDASCFLLPSGVDKKALEDDLSHFRFKFQCGIWLSDGRLRGLADLSEEALEELRQLCKYYCEDPHAKNSEPHEQVLRFDRGDRVLCNLGIYWGAGCVLGVRVPDPEDPQGPCFPYMVKLDPTAGFKEPFPVAEDTDNVIRREICFDAQNEVMFCKAAAPLLAVSAEGAPIQPRLRFEANTRVACRVADTVCTWEAGTVRSIWPQLPPPHRLPYGQRTAERVPYIVKLDSGSLVYVHRDDHTLVRLEANIANAEARGMPERFEILQDASGKRLRYDHQTMQSRDVDEEESEDGEESL